VIFSVFLQVSFSDKYVFMRDRVAAIEISSSCRSD